MFRHRPQWCAHAPQGAGNATLVGQRTPRTYCTHRARCNARRTSNGARHGLGRTAAPRGTATPRTYCTRRARCNARGTSNRARHGLGRTAALRGTATPRTQCTHRARCNARGTSNRARHGLGRQAAHATPTNQAGAGPVVPRTSRRGFSTTEIGSTRPPSRRCTTASTARSACSRGSWLTVVRSMCPSWASRLSS